MSLILGSTRPTIITQVNKADSKTALKDTKIDKATLLSSDNNVTLAPSAGKTVTISLNLPISGSFKNNFVEDYIGYTGTSKDTSSQVLPYMGFYGDFTNTGLDIDKTYDGNDNDSIYGAFGGSGIFANAQLGSPMPFEDSTLGWDGKVSDANGAAKDGAYTYRIISWASAKDTSPSHSDMRIGVDTTAPKLSNYRLKKEKDGVHLLANIKDNYSQVDYTTEVAIKINGNTVTQYPLFNLDTLRPIPSDLLDFKLTAEQANQLVAGASKIEILPSPFQSAMPPNRSSSAAISRVKMRPIGMTACMTRSLTPPMANSKASAWPSGMIARPSMSAKK